LVAASSANPKVVPIDVRGALREGMARLAQGKTPSDALAAELLLMHVLCRDRAWVYAHPEEMIAPAAAVEYFALVARRAAGEPTQYLTGKQEFWGLDFEVTRAVLIPRPETEHVVEVALERLKGRRRRADGAASGAGPLRVADVGTGSGCISVALARELPQAEIFATDISEPALEVARRNAQRHGFLGRIHFFRTNLLDAFLHQEQKFDLVVSNPPYVGWREAGELAREVRDHEPHGALFGGETGSEIYGQLVDQAARVLAPGGILVMELGYDSAEHVRGIFERDVRWRNVAVTMDLAGIERVLAAELS